MASREQKLKLSRARSRAAYVAQRDAAPDRSIYRRAPAEAPPACSDAEGPPSDLPVWQSVRGVAATSQYQQPQPGPLPILRTWRGRLLAALVIACPVVLLGWVIFEALRL